MDRPGYERRLSALLRAFPAVSILGPRQVGKSTLARGHGAALKGARTRFHYFDLERVEDAARLAADAQADLGALGRAPGLICIDEVQRLPQLFGLLRPLLDDRRRRAKYLLLGSASPTVVRGVSESLAGRVGHLDLTPFLASEVDASRTPKRDRLWLRGGFPRSFLARSDGLSLEWRESYFRSFVERDLAELGLRLPALALRRLLTLVAHLHSGIVNYSEVATALGVSAPTATAYIDLLEGAFLVRRLPPYFANLGKRLVKSPKIYLRDSGLLHALLGLGSMNALRSHPRIGASWEGWVIEQILGTLALAGEPVQAYFWRTHAGAEVDLLLELRGRLVPLEIKLGSTPRVERGLTECLKDLGVERAFVVHGGDAQYPLNERVVALPLRALEDPKSVVGVLLGQRGRTRA